jgi:LmbE family N-acetylglucosaminyl deacetylase
MQFTKPNADFFVPDNCEPTQALSRTTHMGIGAHQDDLEVFAFHGINACYESNERWFSGVTVTDGSGSSRTGLYAAYTNEEMAEVRRKEQRKAAVVGDYSCMIQTMYGSGEVKNPDQTGVVDDLQKILETARPEVLYLHNPADKHDTHIAVFLRCLSALRAMPAEQRPRNVYGVEVWRNLDWVLDDEKAHLPIEGRDNLAQALISLFDSQISGGKRYDKAIPARALANATYLDSHATDEAHMVNWAMDLTPLVMDDEMSVEAFTLGYIDRFRKDVAGRLDRLS